MIKKKAYIFKLDRDFNYQHSAFQGIDHTNQWLDIKSDGCVKIKAGYAWDGCTPKVGVMGLFTIGTPDGRLQYNRPMTWKASLVHDVLCQYRRELPLTKAAVTQIFKDMLIEVGFPLAKIYAAAVFYFGPQDFKGDDK